MKRHPALVTLSSEHHQGLVWSRKLLDLDNESPDTEFQNVISQFLEVWQQEINPHFQKEEEILIPLFDRTGEGTSGPVMEMLQQHIHLRKMVFDLRDLGSADIASKIGGMLQNHIRFEERELFPFIESTATKEILDRIKIELE